MNAGWVYKPEDALVYPLNCPGTNLAVAILNFSAWHSQSFSIKWAIPPIFVDLSLSFWIYRKQYRSYRSYIFFRLYLQISKSLSVDLGTCSSAFVEYGYLFFQQPPFFPRRKPISYWPIRFRNGATHLNNPAVMCVVSLPLVKFPICIYIYI